MSTKLSKEDMSAKIASELDWAENEGFDESVAYDNFIGYYASNTLFSVQSLDDIWHEYMEYK